MAKANSAPRRGRLSANPITLSDSGRQVLLKHQGTLWTVLGVLHCAEQCARNGVSVEDIDCTLKAAITLLEPVCQRLEPAEIAADAEALDAEVQS